MSAPAYSLFEPATGNDRKVVMWPAEGQPTGTGFYADVLPPYVSGHTIDLSAETNALQSRASVIAGLQELSVAPETAQLAEALVRQLPPTVADPDLEAASSGEIIFCWDLEDDGHCDVIVLPNGELAVAGIFGRINLHGTELWDGKDLPPFVEVALEQVVDRT